VANSGSNDVSAYRIGPHFCPGTSRHFPFSDSSLGALTPVAGSPFPAGAGPLSVAVDPWGRFAYVANNGSNNVSAYSVGENGALTPVAGSPFPAGASPFSVAVDSWGRFA